MTKDTKRTIWFSALVLLIAGSILTFAWKPVVLPYAFRTAVCSLRLCSGDYATSLPSKPRLNAYPQPVMPPPDRKSFVR